MAEKKDILLRVDGVSKKFCRDIRYNLYYCFNDILRQQVGIPPNGSILRKKEFWALRNISFNIRAGEIVAIVGMNGSGKTTLSRIMSGIFQADEGRIHLLPPKRITPIFALHAGLHPLFTGRENIFIKGASYGLSEQQIRERLEDIVSFSEIGEFMDMPVGSYSTGMKARLSYSIAMATHPDIFVIDEALAVGDSSFRSKCFAHLRSYVASEERSVIYVTNHIEKVLRLAERVLVLHRGQLVQDTTDVQAGLLHYIRHCSIIKEAPERQETLVQLVKKWKTNA